MSALNVENAIKQGYKIIEDRYGLKYSQVANLAQGRNKFDLVCDSFALGYFQGVKAAKAGMKKSAN